MNFLSQKRKTNHSASKPISNTITKKESGSFEKELSASKFRMLNELLYTSSSNDAYKYFTNHKDDFKVYHEGFSSQADKWPANPNNILVKELKKKRYEGKCIVDLGCGEAFIAQQLEGLNRNVLSYDIQSLNKYVTICDIKNLPLEADSVDVAVFCLSLMGTNFSEFIAEANRVLKLKGLLYVAEIESRIQSETEFVKVFSQTGFNFVKSKSIHNYFKIFVFRKQGLPTKIIKESKALTPCLYKKR